MYGGQVVETGSVATVFRDPRHPYTLSLLRSVPDYDLVRTRLATIPGAPPDLADPPAGCRFHPRCPLCVPDGPAFRRQTTERPVLRELEPNHFVACHLAGEAT
jgi:oligopeptide/dipeptide ABC transporter ATP-binding protein